MNRTKLLLNSAPLITYQLSRLSRVKELSKYNQAHIVVTPNIDQISQLLKAE